MKSILTTLCTVILIFSAASASGAERIRVASIFAHTGVAADTNSFAISGIRFAVKELNQKGGIMGRPLELIEYDNHSSALVSKQAAEKAVRAGVTAVFGGNWSSHSLAMAPVLQRAGIIMISPGSTHPAVTRVGNYIFRVCFIDSFQGRAMADFAVRDLKARTAVMMINASSRFSEGLAGFFRARFVKQGGRILLKENYIHDRKDFRVLLEKAVQLNPDVLFVPGHLIDSSTIIRQAREAGYSKPILGGDGWGGNMLKYTGTALNNSYFTNHWHKADPNPRSRRFVRHFRKQNRTKMKDGLVLGYDAVYIFADAVRRAASLDRAKIRTALSKTTNFKGVTGTITFNETGDPIKPAVIMTFAGGNLSYVKTIVP